MARAAEAPRPPERWEPCGPARDSPLAARGLHRLDDLEALELGRAEIERPVVAGVAVRRAEMFRLRPGDEGVRLAQTVCEANSTWSSRSGPRRRWNATKPGTCSSLLSRDSQTVSNAPAEILTTLKRFMAMYMGGVPWLPVGRLRGFIGCRPRPVNGAGRNVGSEPNYSAASRRALVRASWARKGAGFSGLCRMTMSWRAASSRASGLRSAVARIAGTGEAGPRAARRSPRSRSHGPGGSRR